MDVAYHRSRCRYSDSFYSFTLVYVSLACGSNTIKFSNQVKLLRLLQEREYYPVGADQVKTCSARIVLATNVNLQERIKEGRFRRDLYYRLCTHQIQIPALRERREDIPLLLTAFIEESARHFGRSVPDVSPELLRALEEYEFPGNVRELQARVSDAIARHDEGMLSLEDFPGIPAAASQHSPRCSASLTADYRRNLQYFWTSSHIPGDRRLSDTGSLEAFRRKLCGRRFNTGCHSPNHQ